MRTKKAFKNLLFNVIQQLVNIITGFILPPLIVGTFGSALNGLVSTIKQLMSYAQLTGSGIASASTYAMYEPLEKKDYKMLSGIYNATGKMFTHAGNLFSIIVLLMSMIYPFFVKQAVDFSTVSFLVVIIGISGISEFYVFGKYQSLINADQNNFVIAIAQMAGNIANVLVTFILIQLNQNIVIVQLGASVTYVMRILVLMYYVKKKYGFLDKKEKPLMEKIDQRNDAIVHQVSTLIVLSSSTIIVSVFCGLKQASVYSVYSLVFYGLNSVCSIVSNAIYASFGEVIAKKDMKLLNSAYNIYEWIYYVIIGIVYTITFLMISPFISIYTKGMTDTRYLLPLLGNLFIVVGVANNLRVPARTLVEAAGHFKKTRNRAIIEAVLNLAGQLIFVQIFGIYGVLMGCILSYSYRTLDYIFYINKEILHRSSARSWKRIFSNLIIGIVSAVLVTIIIPIQTTNYFNWVCYAIIISVIVGSIYAIINAFIEREACVEMFNILKNLFVKKNKQS